MTAAAPRWVVASLVLGLSSVAWAGVVGRLDKLPKDDRWATEARGLVLATWDTDHSGAIDLSDEVAGVQCAAWRALDRSYRRATAGPFGVRVAYGFVARADTSFVYVGDATLGIAAGVQIAADDAMARCGVVR